MIANKSKLIPGECPGSSPLSSYIDSYPETVLYLCTLGFLKKRSTILLFSFVVAVFGCRQESKQKSVLLYDGAGTSKNDVKAIAAILSSAQIDFQLLGTDALNKADSSQLKKYKLLIIPGGNFIDIAANLSKETVSKINIAAHNGLNYLGICAGAFLAGDTHRGGFNFTGIHFPFYAAEKKGIRKQSLSVRNADGTSIDQYWEDGPELTGWGKIVSKYPDGTPATAQGYYGAGFIVLTGVHPEAPERWRKEFIFTTPIESSHTYAANLIKAALYKKPCSVFK